MAGSEGAARKAPGVGLPQAALLLLLLVLPAAAEVVPSASSAPASPARAPDSPELEAGIPAKGRFLVASRQLRGPFFAQTVVLLLDVAPRGAVGLVVNRPMAVRLGDALEAVEEARGRADPVYLGGPVEPSGVWLLFRSETDRQNARRVVGDVHASHDVATLRALLAQGVPPARLHAFAGYSGWGPGQLDGEIARGDWHVTPGRPQDIFSEDPEGLWGRLIRRFEGVRVERPLKQWLPGQDSNLRPSG